jgi:hypothetical protein
LKGTEVGLFEYINSTGCEIPSNALASFPGCLPKHAEHACEAAWPHDRKKAFLRVDFLLIYRVFFGTVRLYRLPGPLFSKKLAVYTIIGKVGGQVSGGASGG